MPVLIVEVKEADLENIVLVVGLAGSGLGRGSDSGALGFLAHEHWPNC